MTNKASTMGKVSAGLAIVTLICAGLIAWAWLSPIPSGEMGGLVYPWIVGYVTIIFGCVGLLASVIGAVLIILTVKKHKDHSITTQFAATVHFLAFVAVAVLIILNFTIWTPQARSGETRLAYAVEQQDIATVKRELGRGADPNQRLKSHNEPILGTALRLRNNEIFMLLLEHEANPNDSGSKGPILENAVKTGDKNIIKLLLEHRANPNCQSDGFHDKMTPLHLTLAKNYQQLNMPEADKLAIAQMLLEHGADVNIKNGRNESPTFLAAQWRDRSLMETMMQYGADINSPCGFSEATLLSDAAQNGDEKTVKMLLELGANVNTRFGFGSTAIFCAKDPNILELLCAHGADVNAGSMQGYTPLGYTVAYKRYGMIKPLLAHGADINAKDQRGRTALSCAMQVKDTEMIKLLLDNGADANTVDAKGVSVKKYLNQN